MRTRIKELLQEALGVPSGIIESAKNIYKNLIDQMSDSDMDDTELEYKFEIDDEIKISDVTFNGIDITFKCEPHEDATEPLIAGYSLATRGNIEPEGTIMKYHIPDRLRIFILVMVPEEFNFGDIYNVFKEKPTEIIKSLTHELKHAYDHVKKPFEKPGELSKYKIYSEFRVGIPPINEFLYFMYFTTLTENLVRPSEIASIMDARGITQREFLSFLSSNETFNMYKKINSFNVEEFKKKLEEYLPEIDDIFQNLDEPTDLPSDKKIDRFLDIFLITLQNVKGRELREMLQVSFLEKFTNILHPNREKYFDDFLRKIQRFKNGKQFFDYQEKKFKFVSSKMLSKIYKLYAMTKKDITNESIENWESYHKIVKPKYTKFMKEIEYVKKPKSKSNK